MPLRSNYFNQIFNDYQKLEIKNYELSEENKYLKYEKSLLEKQYKTLENNYNKLKETIENNER